MKHKLNQVYGGPREVIRVTEPNINVRDLRDGSKLLLHKDNAKLGFNSAARSMRLTVGR